MTVASHLHLLGVLEICFVKRNKEPSGPGLCWLAVSDACTCKSFPCFMLFRHMDVLSQGHTLPGTLCAPKDRKGLYEGRLPRVSGWAPFSTYDAGDLVRNS